MMVAEGWRARATTMVVEKRRQRTKGDIGDEIKNKLIKKGKIQRLQKRLAHGRCAMIGSLSTRKSL